MNTDTEKRDLLIENKIFTKDDILSLIKLLISNSTEILYKSKELRRKDLIQKEWNETNIKESDLDTSHSRIEFTYTDHTKYSGTFEDSGELNGILESKIITEINLYFTEQVLCSSILIRIKHSDVSPVYMKVEGQDNIWVTNTLKTLKDFFSTCRSQSTIVKKSGIPIILLTTVILNFFLNNTLTFIAQLMHLFSKYAIETLTDDWRFFVIILSLITISPSVLIYRKLRNLWPGIEIQTGKDYRLIEKDKRSKLLLIASIIILPAIISYLLLLL